MLSIIAVLAAANGVAIGVAEQKAWRAEFDAATPERQKQMLEQRKLAAEIAAIERASRPSPKPPSGPGFGMGFIWGLICGK